MVLSLELFLLYALSDWLIVASAFLALRHSPWVLLLFVPLLPFTGAIWCARIAVRRPQFWTKRRITGAVLLLFSLLSFSICAIPSIFIGLLGMPRRLTPSPYAFLQWAAYPLIFVAVGVIGIWLLRTNRG